MSYSISARGATKALALAALGCLFDSNVVATQPVHAADKQQALAAAESFAGILPDDDSKDVSIRMNGSLSWQNVGDDSERRFSWASVSVEVTLVDKETPAA
jgi:hypothetical protein